MIEVWADRSHDPSDTGATLRGMWRFVVVVALLEYKSAVWPLQRGDLYRLFAYGMLWLTGHPRRERDGDARLSAHEVTLLLAVPSINVALRDELDDLGLALPPSTDGYYLIERALLPLVIVDLGAVAEHEEDDLLRAFAGQRMCTLATYQWMRQHQNQRSGSMAIQISPDQEGYAEFVAFMVNGLTLEERLMGLSPEEKIAGLARLAPEQRLAGLAPEQRLAGLAPEHVVLALPVEALRALSDEYIATLPAEVQTEIRARRAK